MPKIFDKIISIIRLQKWQDIKPLLLIKINTENHFATIYFAFIIFYDGAEMNNIDNIIAQRKRRDYVSTLCKQQDENKPMAVDLITYLNFLHFDLFKLLYQHVAILQWYKVVK